MFTLISESDIMERVKDGLNLLEGVMFIYTRAVIEKTIADLKQISKTLNMVVQFCYLAYVVYAILFSKGFLIFNFILLVVSFVHLFVYIQTCEKKNREEKQAYRLNETAFRWIKLVVSAFPLVVMVYGFYIAKEESSIFQMVYMACILIVWLAQLLIEGVRWAIDARKEMFIDAIKLDTEVLLKTADFFKKRLGDEDLLWDSAIEQKREFYDSLAKEFKIQTKQKKADKKAIRKANRIRARQERKDQRAEKKAQKRLLLE